MGQYAKNITKTGFILEHKISKILKSHNWNVINNRYYIDDVARSAREIDIIAYKAVPQKYFTLFTSLIISCKKDEENAWVLLSREKPKIDPNKNWSPLQHCTNSRSIKYILEQNDWEKCFIEEDSDLYSNIFTADKNVFAFQKMTKSSGSPQNDKAIFESISSLMKCQQYEIASLGSRKKGLYFYSFNLISVIESDLVLLEIDNKDVITEKNIDEEKYIADYIVNEKAISSKIHFIKADKFEEALKNYNALHKFNLKQIKNADDAFFSDVFENEKKSDIFKEDFLNRAYFYYAWTLRDLGLKVPTQKEMAVYFEWDKTNDLLKIGVYGTGIWQETDKVSEEFNKNEDVQRVTKEALQKAYRYKGKFLFSEVEIIPF